jgi:hypothetical protein
MDAMVVLIMSYEVRRDLEDCLMQSSEVIAPAPLYGGKPR